MKNYIYSLLIMMLLLISAGTSNAILLDQFQLDGTEQNRAIHSVSTSGQTFTVGIQGLLDSIELSLIEQGADGDSFTIEILDMTGGVPNSAPVLGSLSLPETALGASPTTLLQNAVTATLIDLSSLGILVDVGDLLGYRLSSPRISPAVYAIRTAAFSNLYGGGSLFSNDTFQDGDAAFKTFVDPIPEPSTMLLLGSGLLGLGVFRKKLKKK